MLREIGRKKIFTTDMWDLKKKINECNKIERDSQREQINLWG